jgi:phospholipase/carboxylesterase
MKNKQLWIELPPINGEQPKRLLVFLHGAGSNPDAFAPVAIAWQLKFPAAAAFILQAPFETAANSATSNSGRYDWVPVNLDIDQRQLALKEAAITAASLIAIIQQNTGLKPQETIVVGFSRGATVAIDLTRLPEPIVDIAVAYAPVLSSTLLADEKPKVRAIHLIHGTADTLVTTDKAQRAHKQLILSNCNVTLDLLEDGTHSINQDSINVGTIRVMQTLFKGRKKSAQANSTWLH